MRGSRLALALALSLASSAAALRAQELSDDGQTPRLRLGEAAAIGTSRFVDLPVYTRYADAADGVQITLEFDRRRLRFDSVQATSIEPEMDPWRPERPVVHVDGRVSIDLRFYGRLDAEARSRDLEAVLLRFELLSPAEPIGGGDPISEPFRRRFPIRISAGEGATGSFFYIRPAQTRRPIAGRFFGGELFVYYRSGFEIGWGALTNVASSFSLPLFLTYVGNNSPTMLATGIDYDELFLTCTGAGGLSPPLAASTLTAEPIENNAHGGRVRFDLTFEPEALSAEVLRLHVATIHFRYHGGLKHADELVINASLLEIDGAPLANPDPQDQGGGDDGPALGLGTQDGSAGTPGVVRILPSYFVRGNVDSSYQRPRDGEVTFLPDVSDVIRILSSRFMAAGELPCNQAADADASGSIEVTDAILFLNHLFRAGPPLRAPYPDPGFAAEDEPDLGCDVPIPHFESIPSEY